VDNVVFVIGISAIVLFHDGGGAAGWLQGPIARTIG
jgi:hypothetical protein